MTGSLKVGSLCTIIITDTHGVVFGRRDFLGRSPEYTVLYVDETGNPQMREWPSEALKQRKESETNVVALRVAGGMNG